MKRFSKAQWLDLLQSIYYNITRTTDLNLRELINKLAYLSMCNENTFRDSVFSLAVCKKKYIYSLF